MSVTSKNSDEPSLDNELEEKRDSVIDQGKNDTETLSTKSDIGFSRKSRGVLLMESVKEMIREEGNGGKAIWIIIISLWILSWAISLDKQTTSNYEVYVTSSYGHHTLISTLGIASSVISAVGQVCFAKFADITSRPITYIVALILYIIGYIIIPAGNTISSYIVGVVFGDLGYSILDLTNTFIVGDLTSLKWRCLGLGYIDSPSIINPWFAGLIADNIVAANNYKWGYGMFTIIVPFALLPTVLSLFYYERKSLKNGIYKEKLKDSGIGYFQDRSSWMKTLVGALIEVDLLGLLILATSLTLLLLPLSLYKTAENSWRNPSIIAMFVVGGVLLFVFGLFEAYVAAYPCIHKRNFNRTVITEVIFNLCYFMSTSIRSTYISSFALIYKNWDTRDWTYFTKSTIVSKTLFGCVAGIILRRFRRYKYLQIIGISIDIISCGLLVSIRDSNTNTGTLVMAQILSGMGGGLSVYSSRTAIQAAVTHQNMTMAITTLVLFSSIGSAIGKAVAAAIWNAKTPANLRKYMPDSVTDQQVQAFFGNLKLLRKFPMGSPVRSAAIDAYVDTVYYIFRLSIGVLFVSFLVCFFQKNYYLGDGQNAVEASENNDPDGSHTSDDFVDKFLKKVSVKKQKK